MPPQRPTALRPVGLDAPTAVVPVSNGAAAASCVSRTVGFFTTLAANLCAAASVLLAAMASDILGFATLFAFILARLAAMTRLPVAVRFAQRMEQAMAYHAAATPSQTSADSDEEAPTPHTRADTAHGLYMRLKCPPGGILSMEALPQGWLWRHCPGGGNRAARALLWGGVLQVLLVIVPMGRVPLYPPTDEYSGPRHVWRLLAIYVPGLMVNLPGVVSMANIFVGGIDARRMLLLGPPAILCVQASWLVPFGLFGFYPFNQLVSGFLVALGTSLLVPFATEDRGAWRTAALWRRLHRLHDMINQYVLGTLGVDILYCMTFHKASRSGQLLIGLLFDLGIWAIKLSVYALSPEGRRSYCGAMIAEFQVEGVGAMIFMSQMAHVKSSLTYASFLAVQVLSVWFVGYLATARGMGMLRGLRARFNRPILYSDGELRRRLLARQACALYVQVMTPVLAVAFALCMRTGPNREYTVSGHWTDEQFARMRLYALLWAGTFAVLAVVANERAKHRHGVSIAALFSCLLEQYGMTVGNSFVTVVMIYCGLSLKHSKMLFEIFPSDGATS